MSTRVILVRTHYPGNIGSVARVMSNFGFDDLVLIDPIADAKSHEARMLAAGGVDVLDAARIMGFEDAVADCTMVLATADKPVGTLRETIAGSPKDWLPKLAACEGRTAIIFGPEPHGLTTEELGRVHGLLTLPSATYSSFNLAMAVGLTLAELWNLRGTTKLQRDAAPFEPVDRALLHLEVSFRATSFLFGQNAPHLMHGFRHLILRAQPTSAEVGMLHGLARQLEYIASRWKQLETRNGETG